MMELNVRHNLAVCLAATLMCLCLGGTCHSQTPTPAAPVSVTDPSLNDPTTQALEPVRQAIARQDYEAARQALEAVRQQNPDHPGIALYQGLIERRQGQNRAVDTQSPLRTPRAGVTPMPTADPTPAPEATLEGSPAAEPVPDASAEPAATVPSEPASPDDSTMGKVAALWGNEMVRYAVYGLAALLALLLIFSFLKKHRAGPSEDVEETPSEEPFSTGVTTMGGMDDHLADDPNTAGSFGTTGSGLGGSSMSDSLSASSTAMDFGQDNQEQAGGPSTGGLSGSALSSGGMAGYTMPTFGTEDEGEENTPAPPPRRAKPSKPVDDDAPVSFASMQEDEPIEKQPDTDAAPPPEAEPKALPDDVSFETLGVNFGGGAADEQEEPKPPTSLHDEETMILKPEEETPPQAPPAMHSAPTSTPPSGSSLSAPGTVDLEDIFGSQPLPGSGGPDEKVREPDQTSETLHEPVQPSQPLQEPVQPSQPLQEPVQPSETLQEPEQPSLQEPAQPSLKEQTHPEDKLPADETEDPNSKTLPTFVATPGSDNPEDNAETPTPPMRTRPTADKDSGNDSISFEELFGSSDEKVAEAAPEEPAAPPAPTPEPEPESPPVKANSEISIEEALAATLGDMQSQAPDAAPEPEPSAADLVGESSESLDERTERMFSEQMEKARAAYNDKNWRQAVHFLSIASALHPENEEAKQMLKTARAEKRKSEESV